MARKLFFTFEGTLRALDDRTVDRRDIGIGLFALDCTRDHAIRPWEPYGGRDPAQTDELQRLFGGSQHGQQLHLLLRDALARADELGRVTWLQDNTDWHDADSLNDFLDANGYGRPLDPDDVLNGSDLDLLLFSLGIDIEVIY